MNHKKYMLQTIELAKRGNGHVNPNPMVGCIIVKNNKIIAQGYHAFYGHAHAERNAISKSKLSLKGSTLYVNLEPCCHYGKNPPCTDLIIKHQIKTVVIGCLDPNPLVAGKGVKQLEAAGIEVITGVLEQQCIALNKQFIHYMKTKTPYVLLKYAMTLDGKTATATGESKWISCLASRQHAQTLRKTYTAIMAGINTVLKDDPLLTCRIAENCNPIRIICDTHLRIPLSSNIIKTAKNVRTIIATNSKDQKKTNALTKLGCEIQLVTLKNNVLNLQCLMKVLAQKGINSILLEGGAQLAGSALKAKLVNEIYAYINPQLIGDVNAVNPLAGLNIKAIKKTIKLEINDVERIDSDVLIKATVK